MTCLTPVQRAMAAEHDDDDPHLADCVACRGAVREQRAIRALVRRAPAPPLSRTRREAIAAEVLARSYPVAERRTLATRGAIAGAMIAVAAAAGVALALWPSPRATVARLELASTEPVSLAVRGVVAEIAPARRAASVRSGDAAELTRSTVDDREVVDLRSGTLTVDARNAREVEITTRGASVRVGDAKICVVARAGVIGTVTVFAGSAEVTAHGKITVVEAGMVWVPDAVGPATALRDGELRAAVEAFDRARDPVVAEDAIYWAAVAAERAGDRGDAARRFGSFVELFPASPHADAARVALARLAR